MFHVSTIALNPQPHNFLFPLPVSTSRNLPLSQTLHFPRNWNLRSLSPSLHLTYDDSDDHVIGDCVVFEDGVFDEPVFHNHHLNSDNLAVDKPKPKPGRSWRKKVEETLGENLVPDKWREVQAEINITKREMRKIAREVEFNSKVEKKRRGLIPLRDMNLDDYKAYKEAKLAQMKLLDYASCSPVGQNVPEAEPEFNRGGEEVAEAEPELNAGERVEPKNPRWAVYGRGLEDVTEFFNSDNYDPTAKTLGGRRKLFNKEEKVLLNKRIPDLAAATSDKWLPLHTLAACGEFYLLDSLLKHNVDINAVDRDGLTALHRAIIGKKQAITNYLLRNSANPFVQDNYGWTPLHLAVQAQRTDLVRLLLIKGADKTLKNELKCCDFRRQLHYARGEEICCPFTIFKISTDTNSSQIVDKFHGQGIRHALLETLMSNGSVNRPSMNLIGTL
ncbi:Ankyrin repeat domain-containing protein, chloroplastic [Glycine max]|nr:Ankyrin repeat domain-containing protein, chloroplastic [Glycine max]